jgi:predicted dehydrogenase
LIAVADPAPSVLDFARAESIPAYAVYRELLEKETLDGVIVAVPNAEHVPVALACIERGIAILVEKPVADLVEGRARDVQNS